MGEPGDRQGGPARPLGYAEAGVDIAAGDKAVELIKEHVRSTHRPEVLGGIGSFGGLFSIGALGVLIRRSPLIVLLSLEIMLNGANLALVAFARMWGTEDGQIFALIVMVVAACEVTVGLGLVVAIYRRRLPIDVDELNELQG